MKKTNNKSKNKGAKNNRSFNPRWYAIIIVLFCFILYGNTIRNNYSLDDEIVVENHPLVEQGISAIPKIITSQYSLQKDLKFGYRPVIFITYAIEYSLYGKNPHANHFVNVLIYCLLSLLLYKVLKKIFFTANPLFPFLIVMIFIAHPLHTEVVASLKNRDEMLALLFSLLAVNSYINFFDKGGAYRLIIGALFFIVGVISKLSVLPLLVVIPLIFYFFRETNWKKILLIFASLFLGVLITRYGPRMFLPEADRMTDFFENPLYVYHGIKHKLSAMGISLFYYIKLLLIPYPLRYYYGYNQIPVIGWNDFRIYAGLIIGLVLLIYSIRKIKQKDIISFSILFVLITSSMFLNFVKPVPGIIGERLMFTPSLGFSILLVSIIYKYNKTNILKQNVKINYRKILFPVIIVLVAYSIIVIPRNTVWKNRVSLFESDIPKLENSAKANDMYASSLASQVAAELALNPKMTKDQYDKLIIAINHYKRAIEIYPDYKFAMNKLGSIYSLYLQDIKQAIKYFKMAVEVDSTFIEAYSYLSYCYKALKDFDKAQKILIKAIQIDPDNASLKSALANNYFELGDTLKAIELNYEILDENPENIKAYINLGKYSILKGDTLKAIELFKKAYKIDQESYDAVFNLFYFYNKLKNFNEALKYQKKLQQIKNKLVQQNQYN